MWVDSSLTGVLIQRSSDIMVALAERKSLRRKNKTKQKNSQHLDLRLIRSGAMRKYISVV